MSKGAQWILYRSQVFNSLRDAFSDADLSVAMTRWLPDSPTCLPNLASLLQQPVVQQLLQQPLAAAAGAGELKGQQQQQQQPVRLALVFGREEFGLSDEEVAACDLACSIPIGRLQVRVMLCFFAGAFGALECCALW